MSEQAGPIPTGDDVSVELSRRRTGMSFQRTRMSADRTLMSVIRTSLSLISFGFTIAQFFQKLKESDVVASAPLSAASRKLMRPMSPGTMTGCPASR